MINRASSYSSVSDRKPNSQKPSKVLLVCIYQTIIFQITNQNIFDKFSPFGNIIKILIFEKGEVTKFFIEFAELQQAKKAKVVLDGSKFFQNICKMSIYFSNFRNVDLKHESTEGTDYQVIQQRKNIFVRNFDEFTRSSHESNINFLDDDILMQTFSPFGADNFSRSKTDNPKTLQQEILKMQWSQKMNKIQEQQVDKQLKQQINSLLLSEKQQNKSTYSSAIQSNNLTSQIIKQEPSSSVNNNCIIFYDWKEWVQLKQIYNLFSNFGNIECIVAKKTKVFIKFRSGYFAAVAANYLSGMNLCGNHLNLKYCDNQKQFIQIPNQYSQSIYFQSASDRFTPKKSITVNPPSQTLHVSSIKKENCNENSLRHIFGAYGYVQKVKILIQSHEKNMALVKFDSLKESFEAISDLHNKQFGGRKLQISFTKSKL